MCTHSAVADGTPCDNHDVCSQVDTCQGGVCTGSDPLPDGSPCNDNNVCTRIDACQQGVCVGSDPVVCVALDQCHAVGICNRLTGVCSDPNQADGTPCDDGGACTQTDTCQGGVCQGSNPVVCTPLDDCHVAGTCDPATGTCSDPLAADGTRCAGATQNTCLNACQNGICIPDFLTNCCGNGLLEVGEQCDDGNQLAGDTCPITCAYAGSLIRGNSRSPKNDPRGCLVEWYVVNPNNRLDAWRLPNKSQVCEDDDPTCDAKASEPGVCEFEVVVCLNNSDPNLRLCTPNGVTDIKVIRPLPVQQNAVLRDVVTNDLAALHNALQHLHDPLDPSGSYTMTVPLEATQQNLCSEPFPIDILLGKAMYRSVTLMTRAFDNSFPLPLWQYSALRLRCKAPPGRP